MNPEQPGPNAPLPPPPYTQPPVMPQFPPPPPPGAPQDPYSFILNPAKKKLPRGGGISQNPFITKLLFFAGGAVVLMLVGGFVINMFFGAKTNLGDILAIVQQEQEIIRVSSKITGNTSQATKNAATSTETTVITQQHEWLTFMAQHGRAKIPAKELSLKQSSTTDKRLTQAQATSTFDIVFKQIMRDQLEAYAASLKSAHATATSTKEKALLAEDYNEVQILLEQWPATTTDQ